jgi:hydroxymethylglutaryl-CoA reductase
MSNVKYFEGFSKLSREEKVKLVTENFENPEQSGSIFNASRFPDESIQENFEQFSENTIGNFHLPYGIAPNFLIDGKLYHIPMAVEESSVVAAASKSAKFWYNKGGFQTVNLTTLKKGQIHFIWNGSKEEINDIVDQLKPELRVKLNTLTQRMEKRGGGILKVNLHDFNDFIKDYFELDFSFETADSMGANFINSILEKAAEVLRESINPEQRDRLDIVMAILSNYTPESRIEMKLECPVDELNDAEKTMSGQQFAEKFCQAVEIARQNISRAVTHNKGIMNGIDAVVIATGNDFRAIEAGVHAFAAQSGQYTSLTNCSIHEGIFTYQLSIPLALGTVGGLTKLHPLAEQSMKILGNPSAEELMKIVAAAGLANNFGAVRSLITSGIQKGHMKLHLNNILLTLNVDQQTKEKAKAYFKDKPVSFTEVKAYVEKISK